jgi:hypothetical protein
MKISKYQKLYLNIGFKVTGRSGLNIHKADIDSNTALVVGYWSVWSEKRQETEEDIIHACF